MVTPPTHGVCFQLPHVKAALEGLFHDGIENDAGVWLPDHSVVTSAVRPAPSLDHDLSVVP